MSPPPAASGSGMRGAGGSLTSGVPPSRAAGRGPRLTVGPPAEPEKALGRPRAESQIEPWFASRDPSACTVQSEPVVQERKGMSHQRTGPRAKSRPKHQRASQASGLIATGKSVRHSAKPKAALDDRSHRTIALIERLKLSCERLTRRARDADITIPDAGEKPDAPSARRFQRTLASTSQMRERGVPEPVADLGLAP